MLALLLASTTSAFASDWYLESPDRADRSAAAALEEAAVAAGHEARTVRRFVDGEGWRFVVRVEGFADLGSASAAAHELAESLHTPLSVFETDGRTATRVEDVKPTDAPVEVADDELPDAAEDLAAAVEALGVRADTFNRARTGPVRFEYRRTLPDGRVVDHVWAARDGAVYLEVRGVSGDVKSSATRVLGTDAWLSVADGAWTVQNAEKTRTVVEQFGPADVLPLVLSLAAAVESRREFERMVVAGESELDGAPVRVLRFPGDATSGPIEIHVGARDHLPVQVRFDEGEVVHTFSDYGKVDGLILPRHVVTTRGGQLADEVSIEVLDLDADLPEAWFARPR